MFHKCLLAGHGVCPCLCHCIYTQVWFKGMCIKNKTSVPTWCAAPWDHGEGGRQQERWAAFWLGFRHEMTPNDRPLQVSKALDRDSAVRSFQGTAVACAPVSHHLTVKGGNLREERVFLIEMLIALFGNTSNKKVLTPPPKPEPSQFGQSSHKLTLLEGRWLTTQVVLGCRSRIKVRWPPTWYLGNVRDCWQNQETQDLQSFTC